VSILTDPVLRQRVAHLHRLSPMQQTPLNGIVNPDGILVSHLHIDHFDVRSLRRFDHGIAIPIHWGTFAPLWARDGYPEQGAAPEQFRKHAAEIAPEVEVRVLRPGEAFTLDKREDRKTLQARATPSTAARTKPTVTTVPKADDQAAGWYTEAETPRPTMSAATIIPRTRRLPIRSSRRSDGSKPLGWRSTFRDPDSSSPMKRRTAPGASVDSQARSGAARLRRRAQADGEFISRTSRRAWGATASTKRNSGSSWSVVPSPVATA
jgi:hypothetical protein